MSALSYYANENKTFGSDIAIVDSRSLLRSVTWNTVWHDESFLQARQRMMSRDNGMYFEVTSDEVRAATSMEEFLPVARPDIIAVSGEMSAKMTVVAMNMDTREKTELGRLHVSAMIQPAMPSVYCALIGFYSHHQNMDVYVTWRLENEVYSM